MGSYSGSDSVSAYCFVRLMGKNRNDLLDNFIEEEQGNKEIEVLFDEDDQIKKFYLKFLDLDLKEKLNKETSEYLIGLYKSGERLIEEVEIEIDYDARGYYDPGRTSGPPEYCYPEESDEEREVTGGGIVFSEKAIFDIPGEFCNKIYDTFEKEINDKDFNGYDDGPEYEPDYDY